MDLGALAEQDEEEPVGNLDTRVQAKDIPQNPGNLVRTETSAPKGKRSKTDGVEAEHTLTDDNLTLTSAELPNVRQKGM